MEQKDIDTIHNINSILQANSAIDALKLETINDRDEEFYIENSYINNPLKKISIEFTVDETFEIGELCKKHNITDLSAFLLTNLRECYGKNRINRNI